MIFYLIMKLVKDFNTKKILSLIWQQNGSAFFNAKGIAVGVFSGCFPFFGFQTIIGIFLAQLIKGNLVLAAIGTWISNPLTYVPLYLFNLKVGSFFIKNNVDNILNKELFGKDLWSQGWLFTIRLIIGSTLVGIFLGLLIGCLTFYFYRQKLNK